MTPDQLISIGARVKHWNKNFNGGWFEYMLPIETCDDGDIFSYLSVRFDGDPRYGRDFMVFLAYPHVALALKSIVTVDQLKHLHELLKVTP